MALSKVLCNIQQVYGRPGAFLAPLRDAGFEIVMNDKDRLLTEDELIERLPGVVATIAGGELYTERVFASAPALRVVARFGVGYDRVDVEAATRHGVAVAMAFGTNHESVADYAFALTIGLAVEILPHHHRVAGGGWGCGFHPGLWGRCMGIVGLGRIGKAMARRCRAFEMRLLAADPLADEAYAAANGIELVPLDDLLRRADFVSLHTPLAPETRNLIGRRELALMKPTRVPDQHRARRADRRGGAARGADLRAPRRRRPGRVRGRAAAGIAAARASTTCCSRRMPPAWTRRPSASWASAASPASWPSCAGRTPAPATSSTPKSWPPRRRRCRSAASS